MGRMITIRSLTPLITLQLLVCLGHHFEMSHLFSNFISKGASRGFSPMQASPYAETGNVWYFSIKYYYLTPDDETVFHGQDSAFLYEEETSLRIRRGCSLVAIQSTEYFLSRASPWRLFVLSCNRAASQSLPTLTSGFEAYLWAINQEMAGARRSLRQTAEQIASIATPSVSFNHKLCSEK